MAPHWVRSSFEQQALSLDHYRHGHQDRAGCHASLVCWQVLFVVLSLGGQEFLGSGFGVRQLAISIP